MPRNLGEGVRGGDALSDMKKSEANLRVIPKEYMPDDLVEDFEAEKGHGGGIEVGGGLVETSKKNKWGWTEKTRKTKRGEVKKKTSEAVSKEMNPEEALIAAQEVEREGEVLPDNVEEVVGPSVDGEDLSDSLEDTSFDDGLVSSTAAFEPEVQMSVEESPKTAGMRKNAKGIRRIDRRAAVKGEPARMKVVNASIRQDDLRDEQYFADLDAKKANREFKSEVKDAEGDLEKLENFDVPIPTDLADRSNKVSFFKKVQKFFGR